LVPVIGGAADILNRHRQRLRVGGAIAIRDLKMTS